MKTLSKLTPAQTLLFIDGKSASQKDLLKYTFMDLLLKQVLKSVKNTHRASKYDKAQIIKYIIIGNNFSGYRLLAHELVFLEAFKKSRTLSIMFRHIVKMGYQNSKNKTHYHKMITDVAPMDNYIKRNVFHSIFGGFSLTPTGLEIKTKVEEELAYLDKTLPSLIINDKKQALEILQEIKGNIFLLKNIDFSLLSEIDKELMDEMNPRKTGGDGGCSSCGGWGSDWHTFDSSCSSDSGCSGSGCSGCSGCGGCGGGD